MEIISNDLFVNTYIHISVQEVHIRPRLNSERSIETAIEIWFVEWGAQAA